MHTLNYFQECRDGSPCSHQHAAVLHFQKASLNYLPTTHLAARQQLAYIALGRKQKKAYNSMHPMVKNMMKNTIQIHLRIPLVVLIFLLHAGPPVVVDLKLQMQCDPQLASGVLKFADRYFKMHRNKTHAPACLCIPSLWVELWWWNSSQWKGGYLVQRKVDTNSGDSRRTTKGEVQR